MGDRALTIITDSTGESSPVIYTHWAGTYIPERIKELATLMATHKGDLNYAAARFVGINHAHNVDALSLGMWNTPDKIQDAVADLVLSDEKEEAAKTLKDYSHGDAGVIIVNCDDFTWQAFGGYLEDYKEEAAA